MIVFVCHIRLTAGGDKDAADDVVSEHLPKSQGFYSKVFSVLYDSGLVFLEHLLLSLNPSESIT